MDLVVVSIPLSNSPYLAPWVHGFLELSLVQINYWFDLSLSELTVLNVNRKHVHRIQLMIQNHYFNYSHSHTYKTWTHYKRAETVKQIIRRIVLTEEPRCIDRWSATLNFWLVSLIKLACGMYQHFRLNYPLAGEYALWVTGNFSINLPLW